jgi:hypothetical protein
MLQVAPVLDGKTGIAAAIRLEGCLVTLQSIDEGQDRRFVGGQTCFANANGPAP